MPIRMLRSACLAICALALLATPVLAQKQTVIVYTAI